MRVEHSGQREYEVAHFVQWESRMALIGCPCRHDNCKIRRETSRWKHKHKKEFIPPVGMSVTG